MTEQLFKYMLFRIRERAQEAARSRKTFSGKAAVLLTMKYWICSVQSLMPTKQTSQGLVWKI